MNPTDLDTNFGEFKPSEYAAEAEQRWGETEAYKESARRTKKYSKQDWDRYQAESEANGLEIAALMDQGVAPDDPRALEAVERARLLIDKWFYPCSRAMHAELGKMYVADARFTATYEKIRPGMAAYLQAASAANLVRGEAN